MTYEEFEEFVKQDCFYETIYEDTEGRTILVICMLDAFTLANKIASKAVNECIKICEEHEDYGNLEDGSITDNMHSHLIKKMNRNGKRI